MRYLGESNNKLTEMGIDLWRSLAHLPAQSSVTFSRFLRAVSCQILNISKDGDFAASLVNLLLCSVTLTIYIYIYIFFV